MLREAKFDTEPRRIGLEIELHLVDDRGMPSMKNAEILDAIADRTWASELGQFNLEINVPPLPMTGGSLSALERNVLASLGHAEQRARQEGSRLMMVGILPTLRESDVGEHAMSAAPRFRLLNEQIIAARGEEMQIAIEGRERLLTHVDTITPEAACTSVQCHLQVGPEQFAAYWNAAQVACAVQVAVAANSPFLFSRELWRETRLILFEQVTDTRPDELKQQGVRPRVWFGERWISSAFDLFEENLRYFPALLPVCDEEDPAEVLDRGAIPQLAELTLHNGTIYRWNRPVYAVVGGTPQLRIENRVLPAGPTVADIMANAAFYSGLARSLAEAGRPVWRQMPFPAAADNLAEGARRGIDAQLFWPGLGVVPVTELVLRHLLPLAADGLRRWGVDSGDADRLLAIIEQRCTSQRTGATWQSDTVRRLTEQHHVSREEALRLMTQGYIERMATNEPAHCWSPV